MIEKRAGFRLDAQMEHSLEQQWKQEPLAQVTRIEVFDNLRIREKGVEKSYKDVRRDILTSGSDTPTVVGIVGPPAVGKGGTAMGFWKLFQADEYLRSELAKQGATLDLVVAPFSLYQRAAALDRVKARYPRLRDNPMYSPEHYAGIAQLESDDIEEEVFGDRDPARKKVVIRESASPTAFPLSSSLPMSVQGIDRGNSTLYRMAVDPRTADHTFIFAIEGDPDVQAGAVPFRIPSDTEEVDTTLFNGNVEYVYTTKDGHEVHIKDLPPAEQHEALLFIRSCMAPPHAVERGMIELKEQMERQGVQTTGEYFRRMKKMLRAKQFEIVKNPLLAGGKSYHIDYLSRSLPGRKYEELVPQFLRAA